MPSFWLPVLMGNEYNWRTIRTAVVSSESRFKLLTAKLISAAIFILIGMVIGLAAGFIMSLITTAIGGYKFDFSFATGSYLWNQFLQFWRTFFVIIPYTLLGFMFAIVGRSAMPGIAFGIGIFFLESIITTFMYLRVVGLLKYQVTSSMLIRKPSPLSLNCRQGLGEVWAVEVTIPSCQVRLTHSSC